MKNCNDAFNASYLFTLIFELRLSEEIVLCFRYQFFFYESVFNFWRYLLSILTSIFLRIFFHLILFDIGLCISNLPYLSHMSLNTYYSFPTSISSIFYDGSNQKHNLISIFLFIFFVKLVKISDYYDDLLRYGF